jgi:amino acid transporter
MMPSAGGQYVYIQRAYGKMMSFLYGWTVFTVIQTGVIAAVAVAFAKYAKGSCSKIKEIQYLGLTCIFAEDGRTLDV